MKKYLIMLVICIMAANLTACNQKGNGSVRAVTDQPNGTVGIALDYKERNTYSSNQFAVWIEDLDGHFIKTVYVTSFTANGGYKKREAALPIWVERSHIASASQKEIDVITGATPKSGNIMYTWDLTDKDGQAVAEGKYTFYVEATVYEESRILFSGIIDISGKDSTVIADAEYTSALAKEETIIKRVAATWKNPVN
ncbi:MAG: hypothetical protein K0S71_1771 [Clostridia bacterium]|jgi:hypothetical protein|nr:hypothetical protein [Clostridia bacterium]